MSTQNVNIHVCMRSQTWIDVDVMCVCWGDTTVVQETSGDEQPWDDDFPQEH